jgi:hypothetical protein
LTAVFEGGIITPALLPEQSGRSGRKTAFDNGSLTTEE